MIVKSYVHLDINELHKAMTAKGEAIPSTVWKTLERLGLEDSEKDSSEKICFDELTTYDKEEYAEDEDYRRYINLLQRIKDFISFEYNITDDTIFIDINW